MCWWLLGEWVELSPNCYLKVVLAVALLNCFPFPPTFHWPAIKCCGEIYLWIHHKSTPQQNTPGGFIDLHSILHLVATVNNTFTPSIFTNLITCSKATQWLLNYKWSYTLLIVGDTVQLFPYIFIWPTSIFEKKWLFWLNSEKTDSWRPLCQNVPKP